MVGRFRAKLEGVLGILAKTGAVALVFAISTMGLWRQPEVQPADVDMATTLKHLLRGDASPERPSGGELVLGTYQVLAPPTAEELQMNLEKSLASRPPKQVESRYASK